MDCDFEFEYQGCVVSYRPLPMADGRFGARAVVTRHGGRETIEILLGDLPVFDTEGEAAKAGADAARRLIDNGRSKD